MPGVASFKPPGVTAVRKCGLHCAHFTDEDVGAQGLNDVAEGKEQGSEMLGLAQIAHGCMFVLLRLCRGRVLCRFPMNLDSRCAPHCPGC